MSALECKEKGNTLYKAGKYQEAVEAYTEAIEADPDDHTFLGNRSAALLMLKKYDQAIADCMKATQLDPTYVKAYIRASKCHSQQAKIYEAKSVLSECLAKIPDCPEAVKEMETLTQLENDLSAAKEHLGTNDYDRATYYVDRILPLCPDSTEVLSLRAEMLIGREKYDDAMTVCWALLSKDRQNPDLLFLRGKAMLYSGQVDPAMKHFQEALRVDPDHQRAREGLKALKTMEKAKTGGNEAFKIGKCDDAIALYTEALGIDPRNKMYNSTVLCNRAAAKMRKREYEGAIEDCNESLKLNEGYIKAFTRRAECFLQTEEYEKAVRDLEKASEMDRESRDTQQRLRNAKLELKKSLRKNYYKILDVKKDADENDIKKAYKRAALKYHPDKWANNTDEEKDDAEKAFKDVGEAYSVLSDPQKKRRYDAGHDIEDIEGGCGGHGGFGHGDVDPNELFAAFMSQGGMGGFGGGGRGGPGGMHFSFNG